MNLRTSPRLAVFLSLTAFTALAAVDVSPAAASGDRGDAALSLSTGRRLIQRLDVGYGECQSMSMELSLDKTGSGSGVLVIDVNLTLHNRFGDRVDSTETLARRVQITLEPVKIEDPTKKGRRLYEIKAAKLKFRTFLVIPGKKDDSHRLILHKRSRQKLPLRALVIPLVKRQKTK